MSAEIKLLGNENEAAMSHDTMWQTENVDIIPVLFLEKVLQANLKLFQKIKK